MFKLSVGQEGKGQLKPRISAVCKMHFEPFAKSPTNRRKTREHSAKKVFFCFSSIENVRFYICNFSSSAVLPTICITKLFFSLRCLQKKPMHHVLKPESYTACYQPRQLFLSIQFSQLKWVRLKKTLSSAAELVPNFSESLSWHTKTHWTHFVCCTSTWSNLCQGLLAGREHIGECIYTIWISNSQNMQ